MSTSTAKSIIFFGLALTAVGVLIYFFGEKFRWLGRLPGDIRVQREGFRFYFPVTTMILLSMAASALLWLIRRMKG